MPKTLWHGALKAMGPVAVTVKTDVLKSKYSKPNDPKPDYVTIKIGATEHNYNLENPGIAAVFAGKKGQTFTIVAEGSGDDATIVNVGAPGSAVPQPAPATQQAPPQTAAPAPAPAQHQPPPQNNAPIKDGKYSRGFVGKNRALTVVALQAAFYTKREFENTFQYEMPDTVFAAVYTSMLYGASAAGCGDDLPLDLKFKPLPLAEPKP